MEFQRDFSGKTVVITGATSGIGKAVVRKFAKLGYNVILVARNEEKVKRVIREIVHLTRNIDLNYYIADLSILNKSQLRYHNTSIEMS